MTQLVGIKFQEPLLREIDKTVKEEHYSSRAELVREAVRLLLKEVRRQKALRNLKRNLGRGHPIPEMTEEDRARYYQEYLKETAKDPLAYTPARFR